MKLAGIVTFYNPDKNVGDNILSYLNEIEVLYVIDNSEYGKNENLLPKSDKIKYIPNYDNLGVSFALNHGATTAIAESYSWLLTMDQDSKFKPGQLSQLIDYVVNNKDDKIALVSPWHKTNSNDAKKNQTIDYPLEVMTSGNLINLQVYQTIGGYKDWLFIDCVDFDYCMNLNAHGYKIARLNYVELYHELGDIKVVHFLGRKLVCSNHNYIRRYYIVRNIHYIYEMYYDQYPEYCSFIKHGLKGTIQNIILFETDKIRKIKYMYRGFKDYKKSIKGRIQ